MTEGGRTRGGRGQILVEAAIALPLAIFVVLGALHVMLMVVPTPFGRSSKPWTVAKTKSLLGAALAGVQRVDVEVASPDLNAFAAPLVFGGGLAR